MNDKQPSISGQDELLARLTDSAQEQVIADIAAIQTLSVLRFIQSFSLASRRYPKTPLPPPTKEYHSHWRILDAVRVLLLRHADKAFGGDFPEVLDRLLKSTDSDERIAIGYGLPYLSNPMRYHYIAAESLRTNQNTIFCSIAHNNSYTEYLDENTYNQMVLKAIFIGEALSPIVGLDARSNASLSHMLMDYVRERLAASRTITAELYRAIGSHLNESDLEALERHYDAVANAADQDEVRPAILQCLQRNAHLSPATETYRRLERR
jgi:hypothetical protein